jgi:MoaA/NifB/PqqE/SkfB family radical SAM enzyme
MERVDIKTGWHCNNRCVFCVQGKKRETLGTRSTDEVKAVLVEARRDSDSIVFTGGEVTIRRDVVELVKYAHDLGFTRIQIQTNGRMLAYRKLTEQLIEAGANEFSPALHGPTAEIHDALTGAEGSFRQTVAGMRLLRELGQTVITNSVIVRANYRHLVELAKVLVALGVDQYQLAFVHPLGTAKDNFYAVVPRFALIEPFVKRGLEVGLKAGRSVMTEAIPYCFMKGYERYVGERVVPRTKIFDHAVLADYTEYRLNEGKLKRPECKACLHFAYCEGPWREYPEHYGWDELVPVTEGEALVPGGG